MRKYLIISSFFLNSLLFGYYQYGDTISIEDAHRQNDLTLLELFNNKKIIIGLIKIASSQIESVQVIDKRIKEALNHIDSDRLLGSPDCGLGLLPRELTKVKLKNMVEAVKIN